ncbi:MAG: hypothetical protein OHK0052_19950 [Anaerolineales bacterium]
MIRTIIQLNEAQNRALKELSAQYQVSVAELVRQGVDLLLANEQTQAKLRENERQQQLLSIIGIAQDTATDLATRHDDYLDEIYTDNARA